MKNLLMQWRKWLVPVCYGVGLALWLCLALLLFAGDRVRGEAELPLANAQLEEMVEEALGIYRTEGVDPKLIFEGIDARVRLVRLDATFGADPGELELFWSRKAGQGFSLAQRVVGIPQDDGSTLYVLPAGQVHALRLDAGTAGDNAVEIRTLALNPNLPFSHYLLPSLREILALALLPALASCVIYCILECVAAMRLRLRRGKEATVS